MACSRRVVNPPDISEVAVRDRMIVRKFELRRLRLDHAEDALNLTRQTAKESRRRLAVRGLTVA